MLGLSGWNRAEFVASAGQYGERGWFTDVFVPPPERVGERWYPADPSWEPWVESFREATGRTPSPLEALAFSVGQVTGQVAHEAPATPWAFVERLDALSETPSVTTVGGLDAEEARLRHTIRVYAVTEDGFEPVPPPEPPAPAEP